MFLNILVVGLVLNVKVVSIFEGLRRKTQSSGGRPLVTRVQTEEVCICILISTRSHRHRLTKVLGTHMFLGVQEFMTIFSYMINVYQIRIGENLE